MAEDNERRLVEAMTFAAVATGKEITDTEIFGVYWQLLQEYPIAEVEKAFHDLAKTSKWFPKVAEIIEYITPAEPDLEQLAIAEWDKIVALLSNSREAERRIENPIALRVVQDLGGAIQLGRKSMDELVWVQKEFVRRYVAGVDTTVAPIHRRVESKGPARIGQIVDDTA